MKKTILTAVVLAVLFLVERRLSAADAQWVLDQSTLSYHVSHPLHQIDGVSKKARGKGSCHSGQCDFLIAVEVKTFDSGDSNRDLHMLQATRGGQYPLVTVRTKVPESAAAQATLMADLDIEFAGQTAHYSQVPFQVAARGTSGADHPARFPRRSRISRSIPPSLC